MSSKSKVGHILGAAAALILALGLAVYFLLRSPSFHEFVLQKIEHAASDSIGGRVEIQNFSVKFSSLTANAYGITVHGTEPQTAPPLLQADQLTIRFKIISLLKRKVDLNEIVIRHPVAKVMVAVSGNTNLPHTPKSDNSSGSIFDLGVQHALASDGEIYYNDKKELLNADLHDLRLEVTSHNQSNSYDGTISYKDGKVQYGNSAT